MVGAVLSLFLSLCLLYKIFLLETTAIGARRKKRHAFLLLFSLLLLFICCFLAVFLFLISPHNTKIEAGTYAGAGAISKTINFSFAPKLVFIWIVGEAPSSTQYGWSRNMGAIFVPNQTRAYIDSRDVTVSFVGNSLTISQTQGTGYDYSFNAANRTYAYLAIG